MVATVMNACILVLIQFMFVDVLRKTTLIQANRKSIQITDRLKQLLKVAVRYSLFVYISIFSTIILAIIWGVRYWFDLNILFN